MSQHNQKGGGGGEKKRIRGGAGKAPKFARTKAVVKKPSYIEVTKDGTGKPIVKFRIDKKVGSGNFGTIFLLSDRRTVLKVTFNEKLEVKGTKAVLVHEKPLDKKRRIDRARAEKRVFTTLSRISKLYKKFKDVSLPLVSDMEAGQGVELVMPSRWKRSVERDGTSYYFDGDSTVAVVFEMSYCEGGDLFEWYTERFLTDFFTNKAVLIKVVRTVMAQLVTALALLHDHNVAHRDLKLENIGVHHTIGHLVLLDLGLGKVPDDAATLEKSVAGNETTALGPTTTTVGNNTTKAPEVRDVEEGKATDYKRFAPDVWGAGVVLYTLLACRMPKGETATQIFRKAREESKTPHEFWHKLSGLTFKPDDSKGPRFPCDSNKTATYEHLKKFLFDIFEVDAEKRPSFENFRTYKWLQGDTFTPADMKVVYGMDTEEKKRLFNTKKAKTGKQGDGTKGIRSTGGVGDLLSSPFLKTPPRHLRKIIISDLPSKYIILNTSCYEAALRVWTNDVAEICELARTHGRKKKEEDKMNISSTSTDEVGKDKEFVDFVRIVKIESASSLSPPTTVRVELVRHVASRSYVVVFERIYGPSVVLREFFGNVQRHLK